MAVKKLDLNAGIIPANCVNILSHNKKIVAGIIQLNSCEVDLYNFTKANDCVSHHTISELQMILRNAHFEAYTIDDFNEAMTIMQVNGVDIFNSDTAILFLRKFCKSKIEEEISNAENAPEEDENTECDDLSQFKSETRVSIDLLASEIGKIRNALADIAEIINGLK